MVEVAASFAITGTGAEIAVLGAVVGAGEAAGGIGGVGVALGSPTTPTTARLSTGSQTPSAAASETGTSESFS